MKKIITFQKAIEISKKLNKENEKIALAGGCFDILHSGHINYLNYIKEKVDILIVLLESDENIKKIKGDKRPLNTQKNRSIVLSALSSIDFIIPLKGMTKAKEYDKLIVQINPAYLTITKGDKNLSQRERQCKLVNARMIQAENVDGVSSSNYIKYI